jgi:hypothetical protein
MFRTWRDHRATPRLRNQAALTIAKDEEEIQAMVLLFSMYCDAADVLMRIMGSEMAGFSVY